MDIRVIIVTCIIIFMLHLVSYFILLLYPYLALLLVLSSCSRHVSNLTSLVLTSVTDSFEIQGLIRGTRNLFFLLYEKAAPNYPEG